jgi:hypothetical protein
VKRERRREGAVNGGREIWRGERSAECSVSRVFGLLMTPHDDRVP